MKKKKKPNKTNKIHPETWNKSNSVHTSELATSSWLASQLNHSLSQIAIAGPTRVLGCEALYTARKRQHDKARKQESKNTIKR